jgi:hypothetical protein
MIAQTRAHGKRPCVLLSSVYSTFGRGPSRIAS